MAGKSSRAGQLAFCETCGASLSPDAFGSPPRPWRGQRLCDGCIGRDLRCETATDAPEIAALVARGALTPGEADAVRRGAVAGAGYVQPVFEEP